MFVLTLILAFAWATITGSYSALNLLIGFVIATLAQFLLRKDFRRNYFRRNFLGLGLAFTFVVELVKSALAVAGFVLSPKMTFKPGVIAIPLSTDKPNEIMTLANLITLTPGTLSLDVSEDNSTLYVHAMDASDPDALRRDIKRTFEARIMDVMK